MAEITLKNETTITFDRTDNWVEIARGAYRPRNSEHKNITASSRARLMALCANGERRTYGRFDEYTMNQTVEEAPTPAANTETVSAKAVKLSAAVEKLMRHYMNGSGEQYLPKRTRSETWFQLLRSGMINYKATGLNIGTGIVALTALGKQYAIAHGWLAPANSEPQADITPADIAAVESMGEVAANVFCEDVLTSDERAVLEYLDEDGASSFYDILGEIKLFIDEVALERALTALKKREYVTSVKPTSIIYYSATESGRAAIAQTAPVDGGSVATVAQHNPMAKPLPDVQSLIDNALSFEDLQWLLIDKLDYDTMLQLKATRRKELDAKDAEIRTLERQLAAAVGLLRRALYLADMGNAYVIGNSPNHLNFAPQIKEIETEMQALAAREQSGAGEG